MTNRCNLLTLFSVVENKFVNFAIKLKKIIKIICNI